MTAPPPVVLVVGNEAFLARNAVSRVVAAARTADPETEVVRVAGESAGRGVLLELDSPSLFGTGRVVVVENAQDLEEDTRGHLVERIPRHLADPAGVTLVLVHNGGPKGKGLLDKAKKAGAHRIDVAPLKTARAAVEYASGLVSGAGRRASLGAVAALVEAVGTDAGELTGAVSQLLADVSGPLDVGAVGRFYTGRAETTGFQVADAAIGGDAATALTLLRQALAAGVAPVLLASALASGVRGLGKVAGMSPAAAERAAGELGMPPWKAKQSAQAVRSWTPQGLSTALGAVAECDLAVKGTGPQSASAAYACERAVLAVVAARALPGRP